MTPLTIRLAAYLLAAAGGVIYARQWDQLALVWACLVLLFVVHIAWRPSASRN